MSGYHVTPLQQTLSSGALPDIGLRRRSQGSSAGNSPIVAGKVIGKKKDHDSL